MNDLFFQKERCFTSRCLLGTLGEDLGVTGHLLVDLEHVETHGLGERTALANDHLVTSKRLEGRRAVSGDHLVTLLVTTVLLLVVKVVATDGDGVLHEAPVDDATQQLPADGHLADEWALLVDVLAALGLLRDLKPRPTLLTWRGPLRVERERRRALPAKMCGCFWYDLSV